MEVFSVSSTVLFCPKDFKSKQCSATVLVIFVFKHYIFRLMTEMQIMQKKSLLIGARNQDQVDSLLKEVKLFKVSFSRCHSVFQICFLLEMQHHFFIMELMMIW